MVHHPMLKYQIEKFLGENPELAPTLDTFLKEIDRTYQKFESDRTRLKNELDTQYIDDTPRGEWQSEEQEFIPPGILGSDEQFFKRIVESTTEPIAVFGPNGDLFLTNESFDTLFAITPKQYQSNFLALVTRDSSNAFTANILSALEQGGTWEGFLQASRRGGVVFPLWFRGDAVYDDSGKVLFVIGIMHDASGQDLIERTLASYQNSGQTVDMRQGSHAALQQLADAVGKQSALLQCILDIAWLKDAEGRYLAVNKVFCRWFGLQEIDVIGHTDADLMPEHTARTMASTDAEVTRQRKLLRKEVAVQSKDGRIVWCELVKVPSYNSSGAVTGIAGIMRDISIEKESSEQKATSASMPVADFMKSAAAEYWPPRSARSTRPGIDPLAPAPPDEPHSETPVEYEEAKGKQDLQQRDAIMAAINLAAEYFLRVPPWEKHIQEVLEWLGRATNVSRVCLYQNLREESGHMFARLSYEWTATQIPSNLNRDELQKFDFENAGFGRWIDAMQSGDIILGNVKDFPEAEHRHFAGLGTTSLVAVPISVDGAWWGYLGFEEAHLEHDWKPIIIDVLKTAANLIGAVVERERTEGTYRTMVEHSLQELLIAQHGRIVYANPEAIRNSGFSEQELYRFGSTDMYTNVIEEDIEIVAQALATLKSGAKDSVRVEFRSKKKDETVRWLESLMSIVKYKGNPAIQIVQVDITNRMNAESALSERSSLERLIGNLSTRFINLSYSRIDDAIADALKMLGDFFNASRTYLFLLSESGEHGTMTHEWFKPGFTPRKENYQEYPLQKLGWLRSQFAEFGMALIRDVHSLPDEAQIERGLFAQLNLRSVALVPVQVQGKTVGNLALGFSEVSKTWSEDVVSGMTLAGDIIINALQRKIAEESLLKARERYALATEAGHVGVWDWDLKADEMYIDPTLKEMLGYRDDEIPNSIDAWLKHVHPEDYAEVSTRIADIRAARIQSYSSEHRMIHRNGSVMWFLVHGLVLSDEKGNPIRIVGTDTNISELKLTENALRESEIQNRAMLNSLPDAVYVIDRSGRFITVMEGEGPHHMRQFSENPVNKSVYDLLSRSAAEDFMNGIVSVLTKGTIEIIEYEQYDAVSEFVRYYESRIARLRSDAVLAITREITSRKRSEQALVENNEILKIRNEELDAFSHTVAHDLKNPLTLVIGYAGLLNEAASDMKPSEVKQYLSNILLNSKRMNSIIESLLLLAEVRQEDVDLDELDMKFIVDEALSRLSYMIQEYMAVVVLPDNWPSSIGYSSWVEEVWVNYITNAMKYGGRPPKIELGADRKIKGYVRYWVKDNGKGIAKDDIEKLFSPLTRLGSGTIKGYGLGLSIVKRIVEKLNGKIGLESELGKGSMFWFALPENEEGNA